jgi:hypothetical protein
LPHVRRAAVSTPRSTGLRRRGTVSLRRFYSPTAAMYTRARREGTLPPSCVIQRAVYTGQDAAPNIQRGAQPTPCSRQHIHHNAQRPTAIAQQYSSAKTQTTFQVGAGGPQRATIATDGIASVSRKPGGNFRRSWRKLQWCARTRRRTSASAWSGHVRPSVGHVRCCLLYAARDTPAHLAASGHHLEMLRLLLAAGANPSTRNGDRCSMQQTRQHAADTMHQTTDNMQQTAQHAADTMAPSQRSTARCRRALHLHSPRPSEAGGVRHSTTIRHGQHTADNVQHAAYSRQHATWEALSVPRSMRRSTSQEDAEGRGVPHGKL